MTQPLQQLICPLDRDPLEQSERSWCCEHGHSFDVARQGYVNLLPVQKKRSKDPGDSKAMITARRHFLQQGHYQPIASAIAETVLSSGNQAILDAGCGEGYYLNYLTAAAEQQDTELAVAGLDISKWAIQAAAKRDKQVNWMVASNSAIPLADSSVDSLLCIFGFPVTDEFKRVLKPGGRLIMVDPGAEHLQQLKAIIYAQLKTKPKTLPINDSQFQLDSEQRLSFPVSLSSQEAIDNLLVMTPHLYRGSAEGLKKAAQLNQIELTADVWLRVFTLSVE
ncbi:putative RNA methyltransferase [Idiomarina seosinensis]|uniref:rRNA (Guanine-N1)-methyltransferase n=1 Tax=Idiomarina seosinensis TaxID=281739 RepID=A0A432Z6S6_9GAMM|nr:methyltransferase domain-containing protein [Idiomarina seosinensis]RUO73586.1 rRNA (guanine-N1)-methyltransferase [Idiomarina seosinensis]